MPLGPYARHASSPFRRGWLAVQKTICICIHGSTSPDSYAYMLGICMHACWAYEYMGPPHTMHPRDTSHRMHIHIRDPHAIQFHIGPSQNNSQQCGWHSNWVNQRFQNLLPPFERKTEKKKHIYLSPLLGFEPRSASINAPPPGGGPHPPTSHPTAAFWV